jgi:Zn-dependent protease
MGVVRHPLEPAPYAPPPLAAPGGPPSPALAYALAPPLSAQDEALIRGLRPETLALWIATFGSAVLSVLVYAGLWGLPIACGLVAGMWLHELGHAALARRLGLRPSPIVFVPFVGATQRLGAQPRQAVDGARVALAGPCCGLWFALACQIGHALGGPAELRFLGAAHALLALVDLLPLGLLDGQRVLGALAREQRAACACAALALAMATGSWLLLPVAVALGWAATRGGPAHGTAFIAWAYLALLATAALLAYLGPYDAFELASLAPS